MSQPTVESMLQRYGSRIDVAMVWLRGNLQPGEEDVVEEIVTPTTIAAAQARLELIAEEIV